MALPPSDTANDAFVREVDEEYRREQLVGIWTRYGKWIGGAVAVGLLVLAGVLYARSLSERAAGTQGREFEQALDDLSKNNAAKADPVLQKLASDGNDGYRALARFAQAEALFAKKDVKGAAAQYSAIAGDTKLPQPFRDRAIVQQTMIEFDTLKPQAVITRLQGLAVPDSPWFGSAGEMVAAAYLKIGKRDQAARLYSQIGQSSGFVPDTIRQRAVQIAGTLGLDATKTEVKKTQ